MRKLSLFGLLCFLLTLPSLAAYEDLEGEVQEIVLENGLRILLLERHEVPVFTFATLVEVGGVNEEQGRTGLAHMFEHMAFKGSQTLGAKDYRKEKKVLEKMDDVYDLLQAERFRGIRADEQRIAALEEEFEELQKQADELVDTNAFGRMVDQNGGVGMNAFTASDMTVYFYSFPSNKLELWALLESDRFVNPVLREFYKERNVVMEERRMRSESQPTGRLIEEALAISFKGHPYGQPVIGHRSDIAAFSRRDAQDFYERHYGAKNTIIAVVGDVYYEELEKLAKKYFSKIPAGSGGIPVRTKEPEQFGERRVTIKDPSQPMIFMGYHIPETVHPDFPACEALSDILGQGRSSRLHSKLVKDSQQALYAATWAGFPGTRFPSLMAVFAAPNQEIPVEELETALDAEIELLVSEGVSEEELAAYKNRGRASFIRGLDSNQGMAMQLVSSESLMGDWREMFRGLEKIDALTLDELNRVAGEIFQKKNRSVAVMVTEKEVGND
jgi:predicted Zn-dependent peptidase